jgi:hypothetical protein
MGWFAVLVIGEKYMNDATMSRRAAENTAQQSAVKSAMGQCGGGLGGLGGALGGGGLGGLGAMGGLVPQLNVGIGTSGISIHGGVNIGMNGAPVPSMAQIPSIISMLGLGSFKTLALYTKPFQSVTANVSSGGIKAGAPLGFSSNGFTGVRAVACLEPSLDSKGAPWIRLAEARAMVFIKNILGYL